MLYIYNQCITVICNYIKKIICFSIEKCFRPYDIYFYMFNKLKVTTVIHHSSFLSYAIPYICIQYTDTIRRILNSCLYLYSASQCY